MDPNTALKNLRKLLGRSQADLDRLAGRSVTAKLESLEEAAEAFVALDEWLTRGGFLPLAWDPNDMHQPESSDDSEDD